MAGSSRFHWARAARDAGLITRRRLAPDGWANVKFRLQGWTDAGTVQLRERVGQCLAGRRVVDLQRLAPKVLAGVLPRLYPQMLAVAYEHQDAGRRVYICTAASQEMAEMLATVLGLDGGAGSRPGKRDGAYTGRFGGAVCYRGGKPRRPRGSAQGRG